MGLFLDCVQVYRDRKWRTVQTDELVPGDLVSVGKNRALEYF